MSGADPDFLNYRDVAQKCGVVVWKAHIVREFEFPLMILTIFPGARVVVIVLLAASRRRAKGHGVEYGPFGTEAIPLKDLILGTVSIERLICPDADGGARHLLVVVKDW